MAVAYGTIAIVPKGVWNAGTEYNVGNLVELDGSSYVAKAKPPVGTLPTNTAYWQVSATGTSKATADNAGVVKPDGVTTTVDENAALSVKTAQQNAVGVVKGSASINVGADGALSVNTEFEQAAALANIIAGEAIAQVLGKVSKAIATTMNLDQNALLKNMLTGIDVNDANKVPNMALIHTLIERIGMGADLGYGFTNLTAGLNSVKKGLDDANSNLRDFKTGLITTGNGIPAIKCIGGLTDGSYADIGAIANGDVWFGKTFSNGGFARLQFLPTGNLVYFYKENAAATTKTTVICAKPI